MKHTVTVYSFWCIIEMENNENLTKKFLKFRNEMGALVNR